MFRFTIRELVLLTLVVGLGVGWWVDRNRLANESQKRLEMIYELVQPSQSRPLRVDTSTDGFLDLGPPSGDVSHFLNRNKN